MGFYQVLVLPSFLIRREPRPRVFLFFHRGFGNDLPGNGLSWKQQYSPETLSSLLRLVRLAAPLLDKKKHHNPTKPKTPTKPIQQKTQTPQTPQKKKHPPHPKKKPPPPPPPPQNQPNKSLGSEFSPPFFFLCSTIAFLRYPPRLILCTPFNTP